MNKGCVEIIFKFSKQANRNGVKYFELPEIG